MSKPLRDLAFSTDIRLLHRKSQMGSKCSAAIRMPTANVRPALVPAQRTEPTVWRNADLLPRNICLFCAAGKCSRQVMMSDFLLGGT